MSMSSSVFYNHGTATRFRKRKARFSRSEVHILLKEVRKNRMVVVGKLNRGVPSDVKKRTWAEITARINEIGECRREVIEVVKKWSDLKCDTKRKVAAMEAGKLHNRGLNSRFCRELNQTEKIVHSILEMRDEDHSSGDFGPLEDDDDLRHGVDTSAAAPPSSPSDSTEAPDTPSGSKADDKNSRSIKHSDEDQKVDVLPYSQLVKQTENHKGNNGVLKPGPQETFSRPLVSFSHNAKEAMLQNASLSVQEQHTTNILLETVSRSLELLSESVQQLAETQQEFVRESLQIQRETVQVLRDFTGGAIALMHDKLNGRPAL
uniref:Zgc:153990 n=1 Tax=Takifugu rubripes TaxID=31033 RepID=H2SWY9_TAKRU